MGESARTVNPSRHAWGRARRQAFIEFRLLWEGRVNRRQLTDFFGISTPQASADLQEYVQWQARGVEYDTRQKTYVATKAFHPTLIPSDANSYLYDLHARWAEYTDASSSFIEYIPPIDVVPVPARRVEPGHLVALLRAIRLNTAIQILYQSTTRPEPTWRSVTPGALVSNGLRWHIHAYCHNRKTFRDFVLGRILDTGSEEVAQASLDEDRLWNMIVTVKVRPDLSLDEGTRKALIIDYGMHEGILQLRVRAALLLYVFQRLGLPPSGWAAPAKVRQLELLNEEELRERLGADFPDMRESGRLEGEPFLSS